MATKKIRVFNNKEMERNREEDSESQRRRRRPDVSSQGKTNETTREVELTPDDALSYLRSVKAIFQDHNNKWKYYKLIALMKDFRTKRINTDDVVETVKDLLKGYNDLLLGFNKFLPRGYTINLLPEDEEPKARVYNNVAAVFLSKTKARIGDDEYAYNRFNAIFKMYLKRKNSIPELSEEVTMLLKGHKDLLMEFDNILKNRSKARSSPPSMNLDKKIKLEDYYKYYDQVEDNEDIIIFPCSTEGQCGYDEDREATEKDTERTEKTAASGSKDIENRRRYINELDLSECTQCTPSYRLLPKNYPIEIPRYIDAIGKETLNHQLVSITSGSEDYSFNHTRKNRYEESLFQCEDDRYEMDMLIETVTSAIKNVENLLKIITMKRISIDTTICIEKYLSVLDLRCIERLYGDYDLEVIDNLRKNVLKALPVILMRLNQKKEEWERYRSDCQKVWAEVYAKNHRKSKEHRSFYFKKQDSKNFSTKCLVAEIKDIKEKRHQEDPLLHFLKPDLEFCYCESQIHEDLYMLIKYYCKERFTTEQSDKVMNLWKTFLEPMFGVPSRSQSKLAMEDVAKFKSNNQKGFVCDESRAKSNACPEDDKTESEENVKTVVAKHVSCSLQASDKNDTQVFYGNDSYYVIFRLHQMLYKRLQSAKKHSEKKCKASDPYGRFMDALYNLIDSSIDNTKFEDECRSVFGTESYVLFTLDKLLEKLVKHLHKVASDETDTKLLQLYANKKNYRKQGRSIDLVYHNNASALLHKANMYQIKYSLKETRLSIQLMKSCNNLSEVTGEATKPDFAKPCWWL